jgi:hypothetical protein
LLTKAALVYHFIYNSIDKNLHLYIFNRQTPVTVAKVEHNAIIFIPVLVHKLIEQPLLQKVRVSGDLVHVCALQMQVHLEAGTLQKV